jgi:hypothetical protein
MRNAGVVTDTDSDEKIEEYAEKILQLVYDVKTPKRCRELATEEFDLDIGITKLIELYNKI